ncbi:hypothetical protein Q7P37_010754 [Cladosporium fusiforme]
MDNATYLATLSVDLSMPRTKRITSFLIPTDDEDEDTSSHILYGGLTSFLADDGKELPWKEQPGQEQPGKERHGSETSTTALRSFLLFSPAHSEQASSTCQTQDRSLVTAIANHTVHSQLSTALTSDSPQPDDNKMATSKPKRRIKYTDPSPFADEDEMAPQPEALALQTTAHFFPVANHNNSCLLLMPPTNADHAALGTSNALVTLSHFADSSSAVNLAEDTGDMKVKIHVSRKESGTSQEELIFKGRRSNNASSANSPSPTKAPAGVKSESSRVTRPSSATANLSVPATGPVHGKAKVSWEDHPGANSWDQPNEPATKMCDSWGRPIRSMFATANAAHVSSWNSQPAASSWGQTDFSADQGSGNWDTGHPPYQSANTIFKAEQQSRGSPEKLPATTHERSHAPRQSVWIKSSDIPKGDPRRHQTKWDSASSNASNGESSAGNSGWGTRNQTKLNEEHGGVGLADWSGGIGPAAIDWDNRPKFRATASRMTIEEWLDESFIEGTGGTEVSGNIAAVEGDVAPRDWISATTNGIRPELYWGLYFAEYLMSDNVDPVDVDDLDTAMPWWKTYEDKDSNNLRLLVQPVTSGIDPSETEDERLAREHDFGSNTAAENRKEAEKAKKHAQQARKLAKREKARQGMYAQPDTSTTTNRIKPGVKLLLRSATNEDMIALRDIYNRYVDNAFIVPDITRLTDKDMHKRWRATRDAALPFIVACERGERIKGGRNRRRNRGEDIITPDKVVGFARATLWYGDASHNLYNASGNVSDTIFNSTVRMEVLVHAEHYSKNIGSCLADKMMGLLDQSFSARGGYDIMGDELEGIGRSRVVSNVLVHMPYHPQKVEKLTWVSRWLKKRFDFKEDARMTGVAHKFDEKLDLLILKKSTGVTITLSGGPRGDDVDA